MDTDNKHVVDNIPEAVFIVDSSRKIAFANNSIKKFIGKDPGEVLNKYCYNVFTSDLCFKNCPFEYVMENKASFTKFGVKLYNDTGGYNKEICYVVSPYNNENVEGVMVTLRDAVVPSEVIEGVKNEHDFLAHKKYFLQELFDGIYDGVVLVDKNFRIIEFNKTAEKLTGYGKEELYGQPCPNICVLSEDFSCPFDYCLKTDQAEMEGHTSINRKNGDPVVVKFKIKILRDENKNIMGGIAILRHIVDFINIGKDEQNFLGIISSNKQMQRVCDFIKAAALTVSPVLITGESGVGKGLAASAIHKLQFSSDAPFIRVNCAAFPESSLMAELFGHEKGAFAGSVAGKAGKFEQASNGSILLDEISETTKAVQAKLLKVIQERTFERIGGRMPIKCTARIMVTSTVDLKRKTEKGKFMEDIFYMLNAFNIHIPPLRERVDDIPPLVTHFLKGFLRAYNHKLDKQLISVSADAMELLKNYKWPGNIRELKNTIEGVYFLVPNERAMIVPQDLQGHIRERTTKNKRDKSSASEKESIINTLREENFDKTKAAKSMGISRVTLWRKLNFYGIKSEDLIK